MILDVVSFLVALLCAFSCGLWTTTWLLGDPPRRQAAVWIALTAVFAALNAVFVIHGLAP